MSHFTKIDRANITSEAAFVEACAELGFTTIRRVSGASKPTIAGWAGRRMDVDLAVIGGSETRGYDFGLVKNGAKFDLVGDWGYTTVPERIRQRVGNSGNDLADALVRLTTKHTILATYKRQGFAVRVKENADRSISVQLTR